MSKLESMIVSLRGDYNVVGEKEIDGPMETTNVLGKRQKSKSPEPMPS
jgi:hypothetical protein